MYILDIIGMIIAKVLGIIRMIIGYNLVPKAHSVKNQRGKGRRSRGFVASLFFKDKRVQNSSIRPNGYKASLSDNRKTENYFVSVLYRRSHLGWYSRDPLCCGVGARMMYITAKI